MSEFSGTLAEFQNRVRALLQGVDQDALTAPVDAVVEELGAAVEELAVAQEEMHAQHARLLHARQALEASERRYRELFTLAPDACVVTDTHGKILEANRRAGLLFRRQVRYLSGKPLSVFVESADRRPFSFLLGRLRVGGRVEGWEGTAVAIRDGERTPVEITAEPQHGAAGAVTGWQWLLRDVSERRRLERETVEAVDRERALVGRELHDGVSRELTGALFGLHTLAEDLKRRRSAFVPRVDDVRQHVATAARGLRELSHRLALSAVPPEAFDAALGELAAATRDVAGLSCAVYLSGGPERPSAAVATHLLRIAREAVQNAARHAGASAMSLHFNVSGGEGVLRVVDDGVGFDAAAAERDGALGLRAMRLRAGFVGGTLTIGRRPGGGTSVECRFPLGEAPAGAAPEAEVATPEALAPNA